ncbi:hypothetical protein Tco_1364486, partial [Tanacetum coccineum]
VPFLTSSATPTPEREEGGHTDSVTGPNLRTQPAAERSSMPPFIVLTVIVATTVTIAATSALVYELGTEQLRGMDYDQLFIEFNVEATRQKCLGAEVRMRLEYTLREKKRFEGRFNREADLLKEGDVEIANLKVQLSLKEAESLRQFSFTIRLVTRASKLEGLKERNAVLEEHVAC